MKIRETKSYCPSCLKPLSATLVLDNGKVYLERTCPEHGNYRFLLSNNGNEYASLDKFYFNILKNNKIGGKITNEWIFANNVCNMNCTYCAVDVQDPIFDEMTLEELKEILIKYGKVKLTLSGGEPTLHKNIFDFFRLGKEMKVVTQLASNGVLLDNIEFCKKLQDAGLYEIRISTESFQKETAAKVGAEKFLDRKMKALENLKQLNIKTILSPTIFKGINEEHLFECMDYASQNHFIAEISVNGFTWAGAGTSMQAGNMIMPDEISDILFARYFNCSREDLFAFNKLMHLTLHLANIRMCMNTQLLVFVRGNGRLEPLTSYMNIEKLKKKLEQWEKRKDLPKALQILRFIAMGLCITKVKTLKLAYPLVKMFMANIFHIKIFKYPSVLLPVVINTTCSVLDADEETMKHCMSGLIIKKDKQITRSVATELIFDIAKNKFSR